MNDDVFVTTTRRSYGSRIGNSIAGIFFGFLMVIGAAVLLWWNEADILERTETLKAGAEATVSLTAPRYFPEDDGRPVHMTGTLHGGTLIDPLFGVRTEALVLQRHVAMYQWRERRSETKHQEVGGQETVTTTYRYERDWSETLINSSKFQKSVAHRNPPFPYKSERFSAAVTIGDFTLGRALLGKLEAATSYHPSDFNTTEAVRAVGNALYRGTDPDAPQIGDVRITYTLLSEGTFSLVAQQTPGKHLTAYAVPNLGEIALIKPGIHTAAELFAQAEHANNLTAWGFRALGLIVMFIGFLLILAPLSVLASVIPLLGSIVGAGSALISLLITLLLGGGVIVAVWFAQRPWLAGILAALILLLFMTIRRKTRAHAF